MLNVCGIEPFSSIVKAVRVMGWRWAGRLSTGCFIFHLNFILADGSPTSLSGLFLAIPLMFLFIVARGWWELELARILPGFFSEKEWPLMNHSLLNWTNHSFTYKNYSFCIPVFFLRPGLLLPHSKFLLCIRE